MSSTAPVPPLCAPNTQPGPLAGRRATLGTVEELETVRKEDGTLGKVGQKSQGTREKSLHLFLCAEGNLIFHFKVLGLIKPAL